MYGTDPTQAGTLAATGSVALGAAGQVLTAGVLIFVGLTLVTIAAVLHHRMKGQDDE